GVIEQVADQLLHQGDEGRGLQMLAAGIADEGGIEAEGHNRGHDNVEAVGQKLAEPARRDVVGFQRQVETVLLGDRTDRNNDRPTGGRTGPLLRPGGYTAPRRMLAPGT